LRKTNELAALEERHPGKAKKSGEAAATRRPVSGPGDGPLEIDRGVDHRRLRQRLDLGRDALFRLSQVGQED
jgi:hypothetical protein